MQPHNMPPGCNLFDAGLARSVGVCAALHLRPPRLVAYSGATQPGDLQPGDLLCTRQDMTASCQYDINQTNWRQVREKLAELGDFDHQIDWSDGKHFPWWAWLANTGKIRVVANDGIFKVRLQCESGVKRVVVDSVRGSYNITPRAHGGKMIVTNAPRLYR